MPPWEACERVGGRDSNMLRFMDLQKCTTRSRGFQRGFGAAPCLTGYPAQPDFCLTVRRMPALPRQAPVPQCP